MHGLLIIFILVIVFFAIIALMIGKFVYRVYKIFNQAKKAGSDFNRMNGGQNYGFNNQDGDSSNNNSSQNSKDETVIDTRDPSISKRKIFSQKEGEYVKYEEKS